MQHHYVYQEKKKKIRPTKVILIHPDKIPVLHDNAEKKVAVMTCDCDHLHTSPCIKVYSQRAAQPKHLASAM